MRLGAPKPAKRASMPPPAGPADVGGTNARQTCIHAPNRGTGRRSGHQYPPNVHPRPQPRDRPTFGAPIPAKRASTPPTAGPADVRGTNTRQTCIHAPNLSPAASTRTRSEEHTSELQSLMRISYAVFCLKKKKQTKTNTHN